MLPDDNLYNVGFLLWDEWTDDTAAAQLKTEINDLDDNKFAKGSRFTELYLIGGIIGLLLALSYLLMIVSRFVLSKVLASMGFISGQLLWSFKLFFIVTTGMMRFSSMGKLASLSTCPTSYDQSVGFDDYYVEDSRTYADDAEFITMIWAFSMAAFLVHCFYVGFLCCRKEKEDEI